MSSKVKNIDAIIQESKTDDYIREFSAKNWEAAFAHLEQALTNPDSWQHKDKATFEAIQCLVLDEIARGIHFDKKTVFLSSNWDYNKVLSTLLTLKNQSGLGLLHLAVITSAMDVLSIFKRAAIAGGVKETPNGWPCIINQRGDKGYTPLHYAAIVTALNDKRFFQNRSSAKPSKTLPPEKMLAYLLEKGAYASAPTDEGYTPLDLVVALQQFEASSEIKAQLQAKEKSLREYHGIETHKVDLTKLELPDIGIPNVEVFKLPSLASRQQAAQLEVQTQPILSPRLTPDREIPAEKTLQNSVVTPTQLHDELQYASPPLSRTSSPPPSDLSSSVAHSDVSNFAPPKNLGFFHNPFDSQLESAESSEDEAGDYVDVKLELDMPSSGFRPRVR